MRMIASELFVNYTIFFTFGSIIDIGRAYLKNHI